MTRSANDNQVGRRGAPPEVRFDEGDSGAAQSFDWAEELMARPRRFAPSSRFYGDDVLAASLWWAARRHARPECFLGWDDQLVVDMRPRMDEAGRSFLEGRQLDAFVTHLTDRADGELRALVYLRPHPKEPALSLLQAAVRAIARPQG